MSVSQWCIKDIILGHVYRHNIICIVKFIPFWGNVLDKIIRCIIMDLIFYFGV